MGGSGMLWLVVVGALIAVAVVAFLISASLKANRAAHDATPDPRTSPPSARPGQPARPGPSAPPADDSWAQAMREAAAAQAPDVSASQRQVLSRDALVAPDRTLDPSLWDNAPDGSEEDDQDDAGSGGARGGSGGLDAGFFDALRAKRDGGGGDRG